MRPTKVKGEVEKSEIRSLPIPFIINQTFKNRDRFPPFPFFDPDQVGDLPEIQFLPLCTSIKSPKEIYGLPSPRIFLPTEDPKQWKEVPFKSFLFKWEEIEKRECRMTFFLPFIIKKRPNPKGILFFDTLTILPCSDSTEEKDAMGFFLNISHPVLLQLIERIEDEDPSQFPFFLFITIEREKFYPVKVLPFQGLKKRPRKVPLFKTREPIPGMGEKRPEKGFILEML